MSPPGMPSPVGGRFAWCDGRIVPAAEVRVSAFDRTLVYGLGAFETFRVERGVAFLLERHMARLVRSLAAVGLSAPPGLDGLAAGVHALCEAEQVRAALCRLTVTAGPPPGDVLPDGPRLIARLRALPVPPPVVRVGTLDFAHDSRSPLAGVKSTAYLVHYLLREQAEAEGRVDDLMVDADGCVTEGTVSSFFAVLDGRLVTPPESAGILPGVTRALVLELARGAGLPAEERALPRSELRAASEAILTGSGKGVLPIDVLDGRALPAERPWSRRLAGLVRQRIDAVCGAGDG
ncbi:MAG: aminotransferase class IV [Planctomycetes bacterium]|nr:aminotransferase class IV [Planctomycetota bacterium]